jgi:PAS domain S-box-containing protein
VELTERQKTTTALRESEERYRMLIETIPYGIQELDITGKIVCFNQAYIDMLGYADNELFGKTFWDLVNPKTAQEEVRNYFYYLLTAQPKPTPYYATVVTRPGNFIDIQIDWNYKRDSQDVIIGFISIITNITQRKYAEEKLRQLSRAVEQSPSVVVITDLRANIEYVNPKFTELTGYQFDEVVGQNPRILKSGYTPREEYRKLWQTINSGGEWRGEFHNRKKNGELYWEFASISPIFNAEGVPTHYLAVKENITERKRIEAKLAEERRNLENTVKERTKELRLYIERVEETNLRLEEANRAKSRFLSSMTHELRTPLNAILGFTDLLAEQYFGELNEKQLGYVKQIEQSGKHLLSLINDILNVAKIDAGAMELELELVPPEEFIQATVAMTASQFKKKNIAITTFIDPTLKLVTVDSRKCKQIMLNLLSNALKYTPASGRVYISATKQGNSHFKVEVTDTGIGIESSDLMKIFSEFYQTDRVRDEQMGGTGIGLALTRRLVELHGGEIGVNSHIGKGSTFWFILPLKNMASFITIDNRERVPEEIPIKGRRLLVAEDNETNLSMILDMLSVHHHQVVVAKNGQQAVELAQTYKPELILMDIRMPQMDGLEATRRLREIPEFSQIPIIALTASTGTEAEERQIAIGCTEHLAKPIQAKELFAILRRYLSQ